MVGEPAADQARLQPVVQPRGHDRVVKARDHDDLVDERIIGAAPPPELLTQRALLLLRQVLDDQDLEIGPGRGLIHRMDGAIECVIFSAQVPDLAPAEGIGGQRAVDAAHQRGKPVVLARREQAPRPLEGRRAGKGPESLDGPEHVEQPGYRLAQLLDGMLPGAGQQEQSG